MYIIFLEGNQIGNIGAIAIAEGRKQNNTITQLSLSNKYSLYIQFRWKSNF